MQRVGFILYPGFQVMTMAAVSVFEFANINAGEDVYDIRLLSEDGGPVRSSIGASVDTERFDDSAFDTVILGGNTGVPGTMPRVIDFVRRSQDRARRIASICTGAFVFAEAGVLAGRRATTHWQFAQELQQRFPGVKVEHDRIFIADGSVWTSAGMSAGVDLALMLVEKDLGAELARSVAKSMVLYHRRAGGQSQFSALLELEPKSDRIQSALAFAKRNLRGELSVAELAKAANLSPRQFSRTFRSETGQSPAKAIEHLRVEAARLMMEQTRHPIEVVARETGFADPERMRRAFVRMFGQPPQAIRRNAHVTNAATGQAA
ncbi:MAG: GlxA family transcriptional regulator [Dokdonella sp.]